MIRGRELEVEHPKNLENDGDKPAASDKTSSYECLFTGKSEFNLEFEFYPSCAGPRENCPSYMKHIDLPISLCIAGFYF